MSAVGPFRDQRASAGSVNFSYYIYNITPNHDTLWQMPDFATVHPNRIYIATPFKAWKRLKIQLGL